VDDYLEQCDSFRKEAVRRGLAVDRRWFQSEGVIEGQRFLFDLNQGPIEVSAKPEIVLQFVQLARQYATVEVTGEHQAILDLVANRLKMDEQPVLWMRPYHVWGSGLGGWMSLREWLAWSGHPYIPTP
jgi:hypothetical protein